MNRSKSDVFSWRVAPLAAAMSLAAGGVAGAQTVMTIDGRDVANLAGDGNHPTFHNPPINFAFTFGGVTADNPDAGPGDPPGPTETNFNFTGNNFGGLGFGTASAGDFAFNAAVARFEMDITVRAANTLAFLVLNLKDADAPGHLIEEHQYTLNLGPAGSRTISTNLATPFTTNSPRDGIPNFDPGNGLTELQLQYPFNAGGSGAVLDIAVHEMRIVVPEPGAAALCTLGAMGMVAGRHRRARNT